VSDQFPDVGVDPPEVSAAELRRRIDAGERVTVLDTRRPDDVADRRISGPAVETVNVPFTEFLADGEPVDSLPDGVPEGPVVACCAKGVSSEYVAAVLVREGRTAETLAGGLEAWES